MSRRHARGFPFGFSGSLSRRRRNGSRNLGLRTLGEEIRTFVYGYLPLMRNIRVDTRVSKNSSETKIRTQTVQCGSGGGSGSRVNRRINNSKPGEIVRAVALIIQSEIRRNLPKQPYAARFKNTASGLNLINNRKLDPSALAH